MKNNNQFLSEIDCILISNKIKEKMYKPALNFKTSVFLCGADLNKKDNIRIKIADALNKWSWANIIYPEDIFDELLYSSQTKNLLFLERLLADSVDAIVIIPESPGSFAELGAFANDEKLRNKLICIVDRKYKKDKSFINQGPLKFVKNTNKFGLIFIDPNNIDNEFDNVISSLRKMKKLSSIHEDKISLLQLEHFLLPSIYLLEPVSKNDLLNLVASATEDNVNSFQTTTTALTILIKKKLIQLTANGYKLTTFGLESFFAFQKSKTRLKRQDEIIEIDNLRLDILNLKNRKKKLRA